jgi:hypothetical protein
VTHVVRLGDRNCQNEKANGGERAKQHKGQRTAIREPELLAPRIGCRTNHFMVNNLSRPVGPQG